MNILALKLKNVENLVSSYLTVKWRRRTLADESIDFRNCLRGEKKWITVSLWVSYIEGSSYVGRADVSPSRWQPMSKPFMLLHLPLVALPPFSHCGRICAC